MEDYPLGTIQALQKEIDELETQIKAIKRPMESVGFKADGMLAVGQELIDQNMKIKELEAENLQLKKAIKELEKDSEILRALEAGGVDNWEWYSESLKEVWEKHEQ